MSLSPHREHVHRGHVYGLRLILRRYEWSYTAEGWAKNPHPSPARLCSGRTVPTTSRNLPPIPCTRRRKMAGASWGIDAYNPIVLCGPKQMEDHRLPTAGGLCIRDLGLAAFREVLALQQALCERRRAGACEDTVLVMEHPPVITLGARKSANKLLVELEELARRGIDLVEIRRGGGTTAHNPGQLVFYPILALQPRRLGVTEYVRTLEAIGIDLLASLGVRGERKRGLPGLWVGRKKIASIGVRVSRFVTYHGMAINIQNDLSLFDLMIPCGLDGVRMTSVLNEVGKTNDMQGVKARLIPLLERHLGGGV